MITGPQIQAARMLLGWSVPDLARRAAKNIAETQELENRPGRRNCGRQKRGEAMRPEKQRGKSLVLKRTISLNGRATCVSLEDAFWAVLKEIAAIQQRPLFDLITEIDSKREHANLSSELRLFVLNHYTATETKTNTRDQLRRHGARPR
jgi:predicted DNA-binding ribbon-helix-helix protein